MRIFSDNRVLRREFTHGLNAMRICGLAASIAMPTAKTTKTTKTGT